MLFKCLTPSLRISLKQLRRRGRHWNHSDNFWKLQNLHLWFNHLINNQVIKWVAVLYQSSFDFRRTGHLSIDCEGTCSLTWLLHLSFLLQTRCLHFENLIWVIIQKYIYRERSQFQMYLESGIKMHIQEYVVHLYDKQSVYMNWWYLGLQSVYHILHTDTPRMLPAHKCNS